MLEKEVMKTITEGLSAINYPEERKFHYKRPEITLQFLNSLIPDEKARNYLLSFLKRKLTTFDYSPVVFNFVGVPGSGKDTFVNMLSRIVGAGKVTKPSPRGLSVQFNTWMLDQQFVHLDGQDSLSKKDKNIALGVLKSVSGSEEVYIRPMRKEGYNYKHDITFIVTSNKRALPIVAGDRRIVVIETPNELSKEEWLIEEGGIGHTIVALEREHIHFCHYLATEVEALDDNEYVTALNTKAKKEYITKEKGGL